MKNKADVPFTLLLFFAGVIFMQVNAKVALGPGFEWTEEEWRTAIDDITENKLKSPPEYLARMQNVTKYATLENNYYFNIEYICKVANSLDRFQTDVIRINSIKNNALNKTQIKDCVNIISNMLDLDVTDIFEAQKACNSTNKLIAFLNTVMYTNTAKELTISTPNIYSQSTKINSKVNNVILTYPPPKYMKVYENHDNFDFIQNVDNVEVAIRIPANTTNNTIVVTTFNNNNTFIHHGLQSLVQNVERHVALYYENSRPMNKSRQARRLLVRMKLNGNLVCYKTCVKYNHLTEELDDQTCIRKEEKSLMCAIKSDTSLVSVSLVQSGKECTTYSNILSPVNIIQTILAVAGYIYYFVRDRIAQCRSKTPTEEKCRSERIFYVLYQLTAVTFIKYLFMFIFDVRFFEMYYTPTYSCVIIAILSHFVLLAEFYFMFLFTYFVSAYFSVPDFYIRRKILLTTSFLTWLAPNVAIIVSEILYFVTNVRFYSRRLCFPTLDNFYYITSLFVIPVAAATLYHFLKCVSENRAQLQHSNLKYLVINIVLLFFAVLITWMCFIGMIYSTSVFFTFFCIVGILQCVLLCVLTYFCRCLTLGARKEFVVAYIANENGDTAVVGEEQNNFLK